MDRRQSPLADQGHCQPRSFLVSHHHEQPQWHSDLHHTTHKITAMSRSFLTMSRSLVKGKGHCEPRSFLVSRHHEQPQWHSDLHHITHKITAMSRSFLTRSRSLVKSKGHCEPRSFSVSHHHDQPTSSYIIQLTRSQQCQGHEGSLERAGQTTVRWSKTTIFSSFSHYMFGMFTDQAKIITQ